MPVEVAPEASTSSASQVIAPTQVTGECSVCYVTQSVGENLSVLNVHFKCCVKIVSNV